MQLLEDIESIFKGECIYIANFFCKSNDFSYLQVAPRRARGDVFVPLLTNRLGRTATSAGAGTHKRP